MMMIMMAMMGKNLFIGTTEYFSFFPQISQLLYSFLNLVVGPLSVYVCALNRTFSLVG